MLYILNNPSPLWLKQTPFKNSKNIGVIKPGEIFSVKSVKDDWLETGKGFLYLYDSNGNPVADTNVKTFNHVKYAKKNVLYDGENTENPPADETETSEQDPKFYPKDYEVWTDEDGRKHKTQSNGDGTYSHIVTYKTASGEDAYDHYVYDKDKTISTTIVQGSGDYKNKTTIDADGNKTEIRWAEIDGQNNQITTVKDKDGNIVSQTATPKYTDDALITALEKEGVIAPKSIPLGQLEMTTISGIHAMPYQFMPNVDRRGTTIDNVGRMYADRIVARMPLFIISPGEPEFLAGWSADEKKEAWKGLLSSDSAQGSNIAQIAQTRGRYYVFKSRFDIYGNYLNELMHAAAFFLDIQGVDYKGSDLGSYRWENNYNKDIHGKLNYHQSVAFYIHSDTQIQDQFSNDSRQSQLAEKVNGLSELAKEVQFLTGVTGSLTGIGAMTDKVNGSGKEQGRDLGNIQNMEDFTKNLLGSGNFIDAVTSNIATIIQGGKLIFPEIWGDSHYSKSYSVQIKLRCPNPDPVSWYFDIWAPVAHLLPMVLPKMSGPNGYVAPFLVRCFYKGLFNCQMGIVTGMSISRGDMGNWTLDGLPTSVDINLEIKDLYNVLGVSAENNSVMGIINNVAMLDYIANFCGLNINVPDIERLITYAAYRIKNMPGDAAARTVSALDTWFNNFRMSMWGNFSGSRY